MAKKEHQIITAIYTRVSTDEQARQGYSLAEQEERIKEYCNYKKFDVYKVYKEEGKSGKNTNRPEFEKMIKDMKSGLFNAITIYKLDRFSRSVVDLCTTLDLMADYNCELVSVVEEINTTTAMGQFFIRIMVSIAQLEIEQISERTIVGLEGAVKEGVHIGRAPFGYYKKKIGKVTEKTLTIHKEEAKTVRKIFNLYLKGYSTYHIAKKLIEEGNDERVWKDNYIQQIITNPIYYGLKIHRKSVDNPRLDKLEIENEELAIISKEVFDECQHIIEKNKITNGGSIDYIFRHTLYCDRCKKLLGTSRNNQKGINYYRCTNCDIHYNEDKIEELLLDKIQNKGIFNMALTYNSLIVDDERLTEILNNIENTNLDERLKKIKKDLRTSLDEIIYKAKKYDDYKDWKDLTYQEKTYFVRNTIEAIYLEKTNIKNQRDYDIEIKLIKFKTNRINKYFDLIDKKILDDVTRQFGYVYSTAVIRDVVEREDYIKELDSKYKINKKEYHVKGTKEELKNYKKVSEEMRALDTKDLFKLIIIPNDNKVVKEEDIWKNRNYIHIYLEED